MKFIEQGQQQELERSGRLNCSTLTPPTPVGSFPSNQ